jgi:hypothetical protein
MSRGGHCFIVAIVTTAALAIAACGDNAAAIMPDGAPAAPDANVWVAGPHAPAPTVIHSGGPVQTAPRVVPVFVKGDDLIRPEAESFLQQLAKAPYWAATTAEYGVGPLTILPSIVLDAPPASDQAFQDLIAASADGAHDGWPKADLNTIYIIFLPLGAELSDSPGACTEYGGYHSEGAFANGDPIVYSIIPRCSVQGSFLYPLTLATSHELIEAATDPLPFTAPAYARTDDEHYIWSRRPQGETGDMCEYVNAANNSILIGNYTVQRTWSNVSAAAGHDPCVPAMPTAYLGAAPKLDEPLMVKTHGAMITTKGVQIPVGTSKTIDVELFSDGPSPDFEVYAADVSSWLDGKPAELKFAWDKQTGHNGDTLHLTITHAAMGRSGGSELVIFVGKPGATVSQWWGLVGN